MQLLPGNLEIAKNPVEIEIWDKLQNLIQDEEGILGYKIPSLGVRDKDEIPSFIIRSKKFGIVLLDVMDEKIESLDETGDYWITKSGEGIFSRDISISLFYEELINRLSKSKELYDIRERKLTIPEIRKYVLFPLNSEHEINSILNGADSNGNINKFICKEEIDNKLQSEIFPETDKYKIDEYLLDIIDSLLETTDSFKKSRRLKPVTRPQKVNDFIRKSLDHTFKLDEIQRAIAMQVPDGPQRIRGLAGTGKTVILSMKAALVHKDFPHHKILFVFNTQSMYNQIKEYISNYYVSETKQIPNWKNLEILHAWGGRGKEGLYYNIATKYGIKPKTFFEVRGFGDPLERIYIELIKNIKDKIEPVYDIVLIDEAQDFSPALFETIFYLTKDPKRIIWAYDEFQSLRELKIKEPDELFGKDKKNNPNLPTSRLHGTYKGGIEKDFVLPNSYRNPRINLMIAHGVGMSLYNRNEIFPIEEKSTWESRGYRIIEPKGKTKFEYKDKVVVERREENSKNILENLLRENGRDEKELIKFRAFEHKKNELDAIVQKITTLINDEDVEPEEIIAINLDTRNAEKEFEFLRQGLDKKGIKAITPGYIEKADQFKEKGFVTLTTTFRAKGNEANIVFVFNAQNVINNSTYRIRNAFFVSVTRSRGWCYISGSGININNLKSEIEQILNDYPQFKFIFPKPDEIKRRLKIISTEKNLEDVENSIDKILRDDTYKALLIEKLAKDKKIGRELKKLLEGHED